MHADTSTPAAPLSATRHALKVSLIYLLIRGISVLFVYVVLALPPEAFLQIMENPALGWLYYLFPVMPVPLVEVPSLFRNSLAALPPLLIETLLVYLYCAWKLRRRPWLAGTAERRPSWLPLVLATLLWSYAARMLWLEHVNRDLIEVIQSLQLTEDYSLDSLDQLMLRGHWTLVIAIYASMPLWALLPAWLHFRFAARRVPRPQHHDAAAGAFRYRPAMFASFLLGFVFLHAVLTLLVYTGLWPWLIDMADIRVPWDMLDSVDRPLTFGQIVFAILAGVLAAYIYARRPQATPPSAFQIFIKPALAAVAAYVLTSAFMLALFWLAAYLSPGLIESIVRGIERNPDSGLLQAIALNIVTLIVLCAASSGLRTSPRRWGGALAVLLLAMTLPAWTSWMLIGANQGLAGGRPGMAVTGMLGDARWRNMEQWCTGVVETRHGTWVVGRREESRGGSSYVPEGTPDLGAQIDPEGQSGRRGGMFGSRPTLTTLARLQDDGTFKMMATVPDVACLMASPESDTLFLFTGLDRPKLPAAPRTPPVSGEGDNPLDVQETAAPFSPPAPPGFTAPPAPAPHREPEIKQDVIFRSTDHGATWEMVEDGFMADVSSLGWGVRPVFANDREAWAWGKEPRNEDDAPSFWGRDAEPATRQSPDGAELRQTALFYSPDQGKTATRIYSPEPLVASAAYLSELIEAEGGEGNLSNRRGDMDRDRVVVQVDERRAYAWVSEHMWYRVGDDSRRLGVTTRAVLTRAGPDDEWQVSDVRRTPGMRLTHAATSADGRTYATLFDDEKEWLVRLDTETGEWVERHELPTLLPRWLAENQMGARYFWSNGDYQVVSLWGDVRVSRILLPFGKDAAEVNTDMHAYTRDGGRTWHQLAIPGYLGVMGLSPRGSKLYWSQGNWYSDDSPELRHYDLAQ